MTAEPPRHVALDLHRATALVDRVADVRLRASLGIGVSVFAALVSIDAVGPARQRAVADALGVSRAAVTQRLVELVDRGLVEVAEDPTNGRARLVDLTPAGRALLHEAWAALASSDDGLDDGIDVPALQLALRRLLANAERHLARRAAA